MLTEFSMTAITVTTLLAFLVLCSGDDAPGQTDLVALATQWAPIIYMNSQEQFWPGDVEVFLQNVSPQGDSCPPGEDGALPTGLGSKSCFLTTKGSPDDLLKDTNSFLYGTKPSDTVSVPVYANVTTCGGKTVISYWLFFPFNKGKDMCGLLSGIHIGCGNKNKTVVGNHVGDWEHLSMELQGGQPTSLFLAVHDSGIFYKYNKDSNTFENATDQKAGVLTIPNPPKTIQLKNGRPVLYSALGSHAVWAAAGSFSYSIVKLSELQDDTDQGVEWDTWKALKVFSSQDTTPAWWDFEGRWGNKGQECVFNLYCAFASGPLGLSTRPHDYQC